MINFLLLHNKSAWTMRLKTELASINTCLLITCGFESLGMVYWGPLLRISQGYDLGVGLAKSPSGGPTTEESTSKFI